MRLLFRLTPTLLALVSAVLILGYAGYGLVRERAETITRAELQTQNFARVLEEQARQTLHRVGANLAQADLALAPLRQSASLDLVQARQLLNQLLPADRLIQSVMLLDGRGALVLSTQTEAATGYGASAKSDYFVPHVRGADRELVFGSPVKASDGQWLMPVSRRLGRLGTPLNGVLVAMVRCAYFQSFYDSIERGPDGFLTLFLSSGAAVITSPPADAVIDRNWADSPLFQEHLPAWPTGTVRQVVVKDGIERIYSFRALNDYPVVVTYGLALDTILGAWHHNVWSQGLLITTALLLLAGAVIALRRQETLRQATLEELKNSESHLRESEERFRTLIERSPEATLVHRLGTILYANPAAVNLFGAASAQQLKGKTTPELIHPDSREAQAQRMKRIAEGARMLDMVELKFVRFDARVIEVKIQGISIIFDGAPAILVTMLDITGQKQAEEALRIAATAFESQQGMTITDAHRVILRVNKAFTAITGYSAEEAVGQTPRILKSGRHDSAFYAAMTNSLETEGVWQGEIWNRRKNGEIYPEWLTISAVKDDAGRATHYVASFNDISERVQSTGADQHPGLLRPADPIAQPSTAARPAGAGLARQHPPRAQERAAVCRSGQLQDPQRHAGALSRRCAAGAGSPAPEDLHPRRRHRGAPGQRRVCRDARRPERRRYRSRHAGRGRGDKILGALS
jgi:PAS domain S-box-containing protein